MTRESVGAVVTAFHPPQDLPDRIAVLCRDFRAVTVVDDGTGNDGGVLEECRNRGADIVRLKENSGIGAALNAGVERLRRQHPGLSYIVTFDQDSEPPTGLLARFDAAQRAAVSAGIPVGSVSPGSVSGSRVLNGTDAAAGFATVREPIQSGLLVPVDVLDAVGGFDEGLFIDGVDTDFYWRLVDAGFSAVSAPDVALEHSLGARHQARILGKPVILASGPLLMMQSAPFRYYYVGRNRIHLVRRNLRSHPLWTLRGLALDLRHVALVALMGSERRLRLRYFLRGVTDGLRGRTGKAHHAK